ncbi:MAG: glycosyltransferase family A protein [Geobacteraceae bacterium]|nr:glycosyltransferase family A protein [Geobacteraceae bacterium]
MRETVLKTLYRRFPFDVRGDCLVSAESDGIVISCVINFYGRIKLLEGILYSLQQQDFPCEKLEIILVEDRGGTAEGREVVDRFSDYLPLRYLPLDANYGRMGYSRNYGLAHSRGRYVLFLDDDTVLLQGDFLSTLVSCFENAQSADALVPHGNASYSIIEGRYDYHDPFFMTSRCTAYRRTVLTELGGFVSSFIGQEDVEFVIRFLLSGKKSLNVQELDYFHPPLLVGNFNKPMAVGMSFSGLHKRYSMVLWILVILNCMRHAPLYFLPGRYNREMGRFGIGFLIGVIKGLLGGREVRYG